MTTLTLNTDEALLDKARKILEAREMTLDEFIADALVTLTDGERKSIEYRELMAGLRHVNSCGKFSREEMNERH